MREGRKMIKLMTQNTHELTSATFKTDLVGQVESFGHSEGHGIALVRTGTAEHKTVVPARTHGTV